MRGTFGTFERGRAALSGHPLASTLPTLFPRCMSPASCQRKSCGPHAADRGRHQDLAVRCTCWTSGCRLLGKLLHNVVRRQVRLPNDLIGLCALKSPDRLGLHAVDPKDSAINPPAHLRSPAHGPSAALARARAPAAACLGGTCKAEPPPPPPPPTVNEKVSTTQVGAPPFPWALGPWAPGQACLSQDLDAGPYAQHLCITQRGQRKTPPPPTCEKKKHILCRRRGEPRRRSPCSAETKDMTCVGAPAPASSLKKALKFLRHSNFLVSCWPRTGTAAALLPPPTPRARGRPHRAT